jgi:hypothetical protein
MLPGIVWQIRLHTCGLHTRASAAGAAIACDPETQKGRAQR